MSVNPEIDREMMYIKITALQLNKMKNLTNEFKCNAIKLS